MHKAALTLFVVGDLLTIRGCIKDKEKAIQEESKSKEEIIYQSQKLEAETLCLSNTFCIIHYRSQYMVIHKVTFKYQYYYFFLLKQNLFF